MDSPFIRHLRQVLFALDRLASRLVEQESRLAVQKLFKNVFYSWLFLHTALLLPFHREVWSRDSLVLRQEFDPSSLFNWVLNLSCHPAVQPWYMAILAGQLLALALAIAGVLPRLMPLLVYLFTMNLNGLTGVILDGGNNLSQLLMFYMIFLNTSGRPVRVRSVPGAMALRGLSNMAFLACGLQVATVYTCTALFKLNGDLWQNGMALYYILQTDAYTHPWLYELITSFPYLSMVGSYATLTFQALFPILVWFRRPRPLLLFAGSMIHLGISLGMGLLTFGLIMCISYLIFLEERTCQTILDAFSSRARLQVSINPCSRRIEALWMLLRRLDWRGSLSFRSWESRGDGGGEPFLVVIDETTGARSFDTEALGRIWLKLPVGVLLLPLFPFFGLLHYLGVAQALLRPVTRSATREVLVEGT